MGTKEEEEEARRMAWRARKEAELAAARPMQSSTEEGRQWAEAEAMAEQRPQEPRDGRGLARQSSASRRLAWTGVCNM